MRSLLIATHNSGKLREFQSLFNSELNCESAPPAWPAPDETDGTYRGNALIKAKSLTDFSGRSCLSDDSGLEIDVLGGDPGVDSAIYGGDTISWPERWKYLYSKLSAHPPESWTARFRCVLCYFDGKTPHYFEAVTEGYIVPAPRGEKGFGYDPILFSHQLGKTFGEASLEEKQRASHRALAARAFLAWVQQKGVATLT